MKSTYVVSIVLQLPTPPGLQNVTFVINMLRTLVSCAPDAFVSLLEAGELLHFSFAALPCR
jgi:hypothetical protein